MELKMSASDSTASATSACERPKMPAASLVPARTVFTTMPSRVARRPRFKRLIGTGALKHETDAGRKDGMNGGNGRACGQNHCRRFATAQKHLNNVGDEVTSLKLSGKQRTSQRLLTSSPTSLT